MPHPPAPPLDRFLDHAELTRILEALAAAFPSRVTLESLGRSHEGRDLWCATVTDRSGDLQPEDKPGIWVDGNIHATELSASTACLHLLWRLLTSDDPEVLRARERCTFYIAPRIDPDGAELALADPPRYLRSSTRPHPFDEEPVEGLRREDVDGDGRLLQMRLPDPNGRWKRSARDPRLMIRRDPAEEGGEYYRLLPEGRMLPGWDGTTVAEAREKEGLDLNRNFPSQWRNEADQPGAGPFPASEPEVRAVVAFIASRPNLCHAITFHTYSGVLLRPYGTQADEHFPAEDLWLYKQIGEEGTRRTGYPSLSVFHDFRYHPKEVITGVFDDWVYDHLGILAWTVELWSPFRQAGLTRGFDADTRTGEFRFIDWYRDHSEEEALTMLRWSDDQLGGQGHLPWTPFDHPDFGPVEIGGWDTMYAFRNPPPAWLEPEIAPLTGWILWQAALCPRLALRSHRVSRLGEDSWHLEVVIENAGWLSTQVTSKAIERKVARPVVAELLRGEGVELISGSPRAEVGHLWGRAEQAEAFSGYAADTTRDRIRLEWVLKAPQGAEVTVIAHQARAGRVRLTVSLAG